MALVSAHENIVQSHRQNQANMNDSSITAHKQQTNARVLNILKKQGALELKPISLDEVREWAKDEVPICTTVIVLKPLASSQ